MMTQSMDKLDVKLSRVQYVLWWLGLAFLAVSATLTVAAGWQLGGGWEDPSGGAQFAFMMGLVTLAAAVLFSLWELVREAGYKHARMLLFAACAFAGGEFFGHLMTIGGQRHEKTSLADKMDLTLVDTRDTIQETVASTKTLEALVANRAAQNQWLSTKPSGVWKAEVAAKTLERDAEAKRGGCGPQCIRITNELKALEGNLAVATQHEKEVAELDRMKSKLADLRGKSSEQKVGTSNARQQNRNLSRLVSDVSGRPVNEKDAGFWLDIFYAVLWTIGPPLVLWASVKDWRSNGPVPGEGRLRKALRRLRNRMDGVEEPRAPIVPEGASVPAVAQHAVAMQEGPSVQEYLSRKIVAPIQVEVPVSFTHEANGEKLSPNRRVRSAGDTELARKMASILIDDRQAQAA
jgi:hypothetical protein